MFVKKNIIKIHNNRRLYVKDSIAKEIPLTIKINKKELTTILCSPSELKFLVYGYLFTEGVINEKKDVKEFVLDKRKTTAWVKVKKSFPLTFFDRRIIPSGCASFQLLYKPFFRNRRTSIELKIEPIDIYRLGNRFQKKSETFFKTGCIHSAGLIKQDFVLFSEDIGRHNAVDKIAGKMLLRDIKGNDKKLFLSGRVSSEIIYKSLRMDIPVVISQSAPTELAVKIAKKYKVCLIGFLRGERLNIYTE